MSAGAKVDYPHYLARPLSPKQQELRERDSRILVAARSLALNVGHHEFTMNHIAKASGCPKGTLYQRFISKEDVLVALASDALSRRLDMIRRAAAFEGRARERAAGIGQAVELFTRLNPEDSCLIHMTTRPVREKASPERVEGLLSLERQSIGMVRDVLQSAVESGDLKPEHDKTIDEIVTGIWGLVEGILALAEGGVLEQALGVTDPYFKVWKVFDRIMDAYGWRPLSSEWDYAESLANVCRRVFPEEAQAVYGTGQWYGDGM